MPSLLSLTFWEWPSPPWLSHPVFSIRELDGLCDGMKKLRVGSGWGYLSAVFFSVSGQQQQDETQPLPESKDLL